MKTLILLCVLFLATSCSSHKTENYTCLTKNWYQEGLADGLSGKPMRASGKPQAECAAYGINIDSDEYGEGWHHGMAQYCTPSYQQGLQDGQANFPRQTFSDRQKKCGTDPGFDNTHYQLGYSIGKRNKIVQPKSPQPINPKTQNSSKDTLVKKANSLIGTMK